MGLKPGKILWLLALLLGHLPVRAQPITPRAEEVHEVYFPIIYTYRSHDSVVVMMLNTEKLGIGNGAFIKSWQSQRDSIPGERPGIDFKENGAGKIVLYDTLITGVIKLYHPEDSLTIGDMISIRLSMPAQPERTLLSELAFHDIFFLNADKKQLYELGAVVRHDSPAFQDSVYRMILDDIHSTYERVKNRTNLPPIMTTRLTGGRFAGRLPLEVLRDLTRDDLEAFFLYVSTYWVGYAGRYYRASESFAGWMTSNSPYSFPEIKKALFPIYKNKAAFEKELQKYRHDIVIEGAVRQQLPEVIALSNQFRFPEALELADYSVTLAYAAKDTAEIPWAHVARAQVYQDQGKYAEAMAECDKAARTGLVAKDKEVELQALNKKAYCLNKTSRHNDCLAVLDEVYRKLALYRTAISNEVYYRNFQKVYEYRSAVYYTGGDYDKALAVLDSAVQMNEKINSIDARVSNAEHYKFTGDVYNDQGRYSKALEVYFKAMEVYIDNNDRSSLAKLENDIAYSYYRLGENQRSIHFSSLASQSLLAAGDYDNAGYSKIVMGGSYWELGKYDSAIQFYSEAVELRKLAGNIRGQAFAWRKKGQLFQESGMKYEALKAFDSARVYYEQVKDSTGLAETYNQRGQVFLNDENYKRAAVLFESARGVTKKTTVEALFNLGVAWESLDTIKARKYYEDCLRKSDSTGNTSYVFYAAKSLATLAYRLHDTLSGNRYYQRCLQVSRELDTKNSAASCLALRGYYFSSRTQLDSAAVYYTKAREIYDSVDNSMAIWQLVSLSDIYVSTGEFAKADKALQQCIALSSAASNKLALGSSLQASVFLYGLTGEFEKGLRNSDSALAIFQASGNLLRLANSYNSRGTLLASMGEYSEAIQAYLYADSLLHAEELEDQRGSIANNIGVTYLDQYDYAHALTYFQKAALYLKKDVVDETYLLVQGNIAECLQRLNKTDEAESLVLKLLPLARQLKLNRVASGMGIVLGRVYYDKKKWGPALDYFSYARDYAKASGEREKQIESLTYLGRIKGLQGQPQEAISFLREAAAIVDARNTGAGWDAYYELGLMYFTQGKFDSAVYTFRKGVDLLDRNASKLYGGDEAKKIFNNDPRKADLYNKITFSYFNLGNIREAWNFANRGNLAGIKELAGAVDISSGDAEKEKALKKLIALQQSKESLENTLDKQSGETKKEILKKIEILENDYSNFVDDVASRYPELGMYFAKSNADEFYKYKSQIPSDVAVILYVQNDKNLMIFTLTNEQLAVDTMTADLAPLVQSFIASIKDTRKSTGTQALALRSDPQDEDNVKSNVEFKDVSGQLYDLLIAPVQSRIRQKKRLCIIPSGIFSNMPFQCLGRNTPANAFHFLIEDHSVFYTNNMSIFDGKNVHGTNPDLSSFAGFGVPDATLHYNLEEVKTIGKIMGVDSTIYTDERATESMAKESLVHKKYIHFATHGVLSYSADYSQSYLKFLPDKDTANGNNGRLTMREIKSLPITNCEMVVLSACETAVSRELIKGWNISPANSFLSRNVKTVVASLWKVADEPTNLLMDYYYQNLKTMDRVEALRQAQVKLSQDPRFMHPNYWGAFVLYGQW